MKKPTQELIDWLVKHFGCEEDGSDTYYQSQATEAIIKGELTSDQFNRLQGLTSERTRNFIKSIVMETASAMRGGGDDDGGRAAGSKSTLTMEDLFSDGGAGGNVRLKWGSERYSHEKQSAVHFKSGQAVYDERGRRCELPSEVEYAKSGALMKEFARRSGIQVVLSDHEKSLVEECFEKDAWCGKYQNEWVEGFDGTRVKSLLNDATSGGAELVPEWFDTDLIQFPLLHSEVFPLVDLKQVPRGNSVETGSVGNPAITWGVGEGTPIGLFNTDSLVAGIDTSIFPVSVAVEVGRDFLSDSPADVGRVLVENIGQKMAADLDRVVVAGDGTSEPEGITQASGLTDVNSENDTTGPPTLADYLSLMFGIGKQYRRGMFNPVYLSNDTTYQRSRNIKVDPAATSTDQRPIFGVESVGTYKTLAHDHKISNDLGNSTAIYCAMKKYRMYRRAGASTEWVSGGKELAITNQLLLVVRGRFGGRVIDNNAFAISSDFQS